MSGISGIINKKSNKIDEKNLYKMSSLLSHRGVDFNHVFIDGNFGSAYTELFIDEFNSNQQQIFVIEDKKFYITYDGNFYNYQEIKEELINKSIIFKTELVAEVVLAAYYAWGDSCFNKFNGEWALSIYSFTDQELLLCRDRFGIKPLYYYLDNNIFLYASEKKAIALSGFIDLNFNYKNIKLAIKDPFELELKSETEFTNIFSLKAAHILKIKNNNLEIFKWYNLEQNINTSTELDFNEKVKKFQELFVDSCKIRANTKSKVASSLSGGMDSSSIVSILSSFNIKNYKTYTHIFKNSYLDELKYAKIVANSSRVQLKEINFTTDELINEIDDILFYFESIYGGMPDSPYRIYKAQSKDGYKISIDGHGADEMLAGYPWHRDNSSNLKDKLLKDFTQTLLPRILKNFDSVASANSIEIRTPFLDYRLVEFIFSLNDDDILFDGWSKYILRKSMEGKLDSRISWRKDKIGFNSPVDALLKNELKDWVLKSIENFSDKNLEFQGKDLKNEFLVAIKENKSLGKEFWKKINAIKLIEIFRGKNA